MHNRKLADKAGHASCRHNSHRRSVVHRHDNWAGGSKRRHRGCRPSRREAGKLRGVVRGDFSGDGRQSGNHRIATGQLQDRLPRRAHYEHRCSGGKVLIERVLAPGAADAVNFVRSRL